MSDKARIAAIRARSDILQILEEAGGRIQMGRSWEDEVQVFCPFCEDAASKKPAGRANTLKGLYFCFSCGFGGDAIKLIREIRGLTFVEALEYLDWLFPEEGERDEPWTT